MASISNGDELEAIAEQRAELMKAKDLESDMDLAFRLQLEEVMAASLSLLPSSLSSSPSQPPESSDGTLNFSDVQSKELDKLEQERRDREQSEIETKRLREDLCRSLHDGKLAIDIHNLPEDEWEELGDEFQRPFGEGSSSSSPLTIPNFRLYFKGMVNAEIIRGSEVTLAGIGVAICDPTGNVVFQLSKPLLGTAMGRLVAEIKALIEGLETALALDLKRLTVCCDYFPVYQYARQRWQPKQRKVAKLTETVELLQKKFNYCRPSLVARSDVKFAFKLARNAIVLQKSRPLESNHVRNLKETCPICQEEIDQDKMFTIDGCRHKYCFSCMRQHIEAKLFNGMVPKCPHETCKSELNIDSCGRFLMPKHIKIMKEWIREISMPVAERVYCPYPKCSVLMSKSEASDFARKENVSGRLFGARKCMECYGLFCDNCKVPWHKNMTCKEYKRSNPSAHPEDAKLKSLATRNLWRQCVKCNHMIELAEGCYHMTCRCGYQFCYNCGSEWVDKKPTCSCPLWDEENILFDDSLSDEEDEDNDDGYDDDYSDSESDLY